MNMGNVMIGREDYGYRIKVEGRATFECSPSLKNFADNITPGSVSKIVVDLESCIWMDSTFMGTLAILGLKSKKLDFVVEIHNADQKNSRLIRELGIESLFKFISCEPKKTDGKWEDIPESQKVDNKVMSETILKAHETLVEADSSNAPKFEKVIDLVKKDMK